MSSMLTLPDRLEALLCVSGKIQGSHIDEAVGASMLFC